jgi:mRNA interferase RelE/StbE
LPPSKAKNPESALRTSEKTSAWYVEFTAPAERELRKLDRQWQAEILDFLEDVAALPDPRVRGKALTGNKRGWWRYRVGDYRILCELQHQRMIITVLTVAHRREVYD